MVIRPTQPRERLRSLFDAVRKRWRTRAGLRVVGRAALAASIPILAAVVAARALTLDGRALGILAAVAILTSLAAAVLVALRAGALDVIRHSPDVKIARFIEERADQTLDDVLVSAVEESSERDGEGFRALVIASAADRLAAVPPQHIVPAASIRHAAFEALGGIAVLVIAVVVAMPSLPGSISVRVYPGHAKVRPGKPLMITATVNGSGKSIREVTPVLTLVEGTRREERTVPFSRLPGQQEWMAIVPVEGTFKYFVTAGAARSQDYTVIALMPARAERIELHYEYPAFTRLAPRHENDGGDIYAPSGTRVLVRVHADKPVSTGKLALTGAGPAPLTAAAERVLEGRLVLSKDDSYRVALVDADGLGSDGRDRVLHPLDGRSPTRRAHPPARRRPADHTARGGGDRGAGG